MRGLIRREFARFLVAGAVNTLATYTLYLILLGPSGYLLAYTIAYCVGIVVSYFLNALFVFRTKLEVAGFLRFPVVYITQYFAGAAALWVAVEWLGMVREIGLLFAIAATVPVTFAVSRLVLKGNLE